MAPRREVGEEVPPFPRPVPLARPESPSRAARAIG